MSRPISVVVNTYNRAASLRAVLAALEQLDYPNFEVVVVNGPSTDDTEAVVAEYSASLKHARCEERNLSLSRNIGIRLAAGEIVAFLDDDAYPDPAWLDALAGAYDDPETGAAGGPVYSYTGTDIQAWRSFVDRLGHAWSQQQPADDDFLRLQMLPESDVVPYTIGTNSSFRRNLLVELGGFDEQFAYYLDESDVCRRMVDAGYVVRPLDEGFVYHKFLPSDIRERREVVKDHYEILKSRFYFALKHGPGHRSFAEMCQSLARFVDERTAHVEEAWTRGLLDDEARRKFERDLVEASDAAVEAVRGPGARTRSVAWFDAISEPLVRFPTRRPADQKLHVCFISQEYPPAHLNGIGRVVHVLATGLAHRGHVVRVLSPGDNHPRVDLEDGVWVHRMPVVPFAPPRAPVIPAHLWDFSATMQREIERIDAHRKVDLVQAPNWDSQGIACELDGRIPFVVGLYTPLRTLISVDPTFGAAFEGGDPTLRAMVEVERFGYERADGILACGPSVVEEVESQYGIRLEPSRLGLVAHGLPDRSGGVRAASLPGEVNVLFVGRLEARKGVDVLLGCIPELTSRHPGVAFTLIGDDSFELQGGTTYRRRFEHSVEASGARVHFAGAVDDDELWGYYAGCDVVVAPSRFESFGLMLVEAMMFAKPVVASAVGGMREVVLDGETGVLVPPGDADALAEALASLVSSPESRRVMGAAGRRRYEENYSQTAMVEGVESFYRRLLRNPRPSGTPRFGGPERSLQPSAPRGARPLE